MTIVEDFNFEASVKDALREALKERGHINILIAGSLPDEPLCQAFSSLFLVLAL